MRRLVLAVVLMWGSVAAADPWQLDRRPVVVHKNPRYATKLAIMGTLGGLGVMYFSGKMGAYESDAAKVFAGSFMVIAPSWGAWWVDDKIVVTPGMVMRLGAFAAAGTAIGIDHQCNAIARMTEGTSGCTGSTTRSDTVLGIGLALATAGTVYDILDAGRRARERRFIVVPTMTPTTAGVGFSAAF